MRQFSKIGKGLVVFILFAFVITGVVQAGETAKIDLNKATAQELVKLKGIGKKYAERILEYRESHGKFKKIEDIMKVKGIGKKTFDSIKDIIFIEAEK